MYIDDGDDDDDEDHAAGGGVVGRLWHERKWRIKSAPRVRTKLWRAARRSVCLSAALRSCGSLAVGDRSERYSRSLHPSLPFPAVWHHVRIVIRILAI